MPNHSNHSSQTKQKEPTDYQNYSWHISGMDCPGCATKIEKALRKLKEVNNVRVTFATERLLVNLTKNSDPNKIKHIISKLGFTLSGSNKKQQLPLWKNYFTFTVITILMLISASITFFNPSLGHQIFTITTILSTIPFATKAFQQFKNHTWFGIETLMTVAAIGALILGETFEACLVLWLFSIGEMLEGFAGQKAKSGIQQLMKLTPDTVWQIKEEKRIEVPIDFLLPGDTIEVLPGDRLPTDTLLQTHKGLFDESVLTGESLPVTHIAGDTVMAGCLVVDHPVRLTVTSESGNNAIDRIIMLIEDAESHQAPIARIIDRFSTWYTPLVMLIALLVMIIPPLFFNTPWIPSIYKALALLLIACPCALVISIPVAVTASLTAASRFGALIKGGATLEQLKNIKYLAFDKTGTLTQGKPTINSIISVTANENEILKTAASIEQGSNHPLAKAIVQEAKHRHLKLDQAHSIKTLNGHGIQGQIENKTIQILSPKKTDPDLLDQHKLQPTIQDIESKGNTIAVVIKEDHIIGLIALSDTLRDNTKNVISHLKRMGIHCLMLTGDNPYTAKSIAQQLNIDYQAHLLPEDKVSAIQALQAKDNGIVAMIGDGINDAPALKTAEIGIAIGSGSDIALETADAALIHDRLSEIPRIIELSRNNSKITSQNIGLALGINLLFLILTIFGVTGLMAAVLSDAGGTVLVTLNALRLMKKKKTI